MYKDDINHQYSLDDFDQPMGLKMDPENYWIKKADMIPWEKTEAKYAKLFPSNTGMSAKPPHMVLGALIIQMNSAALMQCSCSTSKRIHIFSISLDSRVIEWKFRSLLLLW